MHNNRATSPFVADCHTKASNKHVGHSSTANFSRRHCSPPACERHQVRPNDVEHRATVAAAMLAMAARGSRCVPGQTISTRTGSPTPDDLDELITKVGKEPSFFLAIAAFGRECTRRGVPSPTSNMYGSPFVAWRGIPPVPFNKIPIVEGRSKILLICTGEARKGVIGLYQPNLPGDVSMGLAVRFMGINRKAIASYLISLYCSLAVLTDDALGVLENVGIAITLGDRALVMRDGSIARAYEISPPRESIDRTLRRSVCVSVCWPTLASVPTPVILPKGVQMVFSLRHRALLVLESVAVLVPGAQPAGRDTDTVRLTWGFGGLPLIEKERGEFAKALAKDDIRVERIGPFPNHAPTIQAVVGGSADFSFGTCTTAQPDSYGQLSIWRMDERLSGRRYDARRCGSACPPLDDLRNERRKLSTPGRCRPCAAQTRGASDSKSDSGVP